MDFKAGEYKIVYYCSKCDLVLPSGNQFVVEVKNYEYSPMYMAHRTCLSSVSRHFVSNKSKLNYKQPIREVMETPMEYTLREIQQDFDIVFTEEYKEEFIQKEKDDIIEAYNSSIRNGMSSNEKGLWRGKEYYKEKYKKQ